VRHQCPGRSERLLEQPVLYFFVGIYSFIDPASTLEGFLNPEENRGLERLEVWEAGGAPVCA